MSGGVWSWLASLRECQPVLVNDGQFAMSKISDALVCCIHSQISVHALGVQLGSAQQV